MADGDRKTPVEPAVAEQRRKSSGSLKAVRVPPRPDSALDPDPVLQARGVNGRYRGITQSESDPPKIAENPDADMDHPRFDRAPREKTWDVVPPELVANSPGLRAIETYARDAKHLAKRAAMRVESFDAKNACEHADIKIAVLGLETKVVAVQEQLPKATRSGRIWAFGIATVTTVGMVIAAWLGVRAAHETAEATREQAAATREMIRAAAQAAPEHK
jgi:hypothetical protein